MFDNALAAVAPQLRQGAAATDDGRGRGAGLFTRLGGPGAATAHGRWACECCVPEYERALRRPR